MKKLLDEDIYNQRILDLEIRLEKLRNEKTVMVSIIPVKKSFNRSLLKRHPLKTRSLKIPYLLLYFM